MRHQFFSIVSKRTIIISGGVVFLALIVVTAVHIYMVTTPKSDGYINTQHHIARLDLQGNPSEREMENTLLVIRNQPGVLNAYLNPTEKSIAYIYSSDRTNSTTVFNALSNGNNATNTIHAVKYQVATTTNGSCPMNANQVSMFRRIGAYMHAVLD